MTLQPHETAGLALGGISLFGQTLTACVHGSERYDKFEDLGSEFADIERNLGWARARRGQPARTDAYRACARARRDQPARTDA